MYILYVRGCLVGSCLYYFIGSVGGWSDGVVFEVIWVEFFSLVLFSFFVLMCTVCFLFVWVIVRRFFSWCECCYIVFVCMFFMYVFLYVGWCTATLLVRKLV